MKICVFLLLLSWVCQPLLAQTNWEMILSNHECVLLGEEAHGVRTFYEKKRELISQIDSSREKKVLLLIESPLVSSVLSALQDEASNYHYHHTNTAENIQFFGRYANFGFDLQEDCRYTQFGEFLVSRGYISQSDSDLLEMDSLLALCMIGDHYEKDVLTPPESAAL